MSERARERPPRLAVVVPVYKQPQFLAEAVLSATRSSVSAQLKIVVVNDGCPYASTDEIGRRLADMFPGQVHYLRQPNRGLSAARNGGIRFALDAWPTIRAVLPLDADNKLSTHTLERLWAVLGNSEPDVGWAYQDLTIFGARHSGWRTGVPFSRLRLAYENYCDAASLVRREVFEQGAWYDEKMRRGYEDWDFALHAGDLGFHGVHVPDTGFLYRERHTSMLTGARAGHQEIVAGMRANHPVLYTTPALLDLEHAEMPRFAIVDLDAGVVSLVTDPLDPEPPSETVEQYAARLAAWQREEEPKRTYLPPFTVFAAGHWLEALARLRLLPGLLFTAQASATQASCVVLDVARSTSPNLVELTAGRGTAHALVLTRTSELPGLAAGGRWPASAENLVLDIGPSILPWPEAPDEVVAGFEAALATLASAALASGRATATAVPGGARPGRADPGADGADWPAMGSHAHFAERLHLDGGESRFPHGRTGGTTNVLFAVPWLTYAGVDKCVINLARELRRMDGRYSPHLLTTHTNRLEVEREALDCFDTVSFLPTAPARRAIALTRAMASAEVVVNAHSLAAYEILPDLRGAPCGKVISYLHVIDQDDFGLPWGYPLIASNRYEAMIDRFVVISEDLRRVCVRNGVPLDKVATVPNAPTLAPPTLARAKAIAAGKAKRRFGPRRPVRILFAGRLDRQKGVDRLLPITSALRRADVPFELRVVGSAVFGGTKVSLPAGTVALPPTFDPGRLARYYAEADVFLLPSRWEGVPLAVLEAMAYGAVVVATDVGGVSEVVEHGHTGFLVDPTLETGAMARSVVACVRRLLDEPEETAALRQRAAETSMSLSWSASAARLAEVIEEVMA